MWPPGAVSSHLFLQHRLLERPVLPILGVLKLPSGLVTNFNLFFFSETEKLRKPYIFTLSLHKISRVFFGSSFSLLERLPFFPMI